MRVYINGEARELQERLTLAGVAELLKLDARKVAMEVNLAILPRSQYGETMLSEGDRVEIVQLHRGRLMKHEPLIIAGKEYTSRLLVGSGKYPSMKQMMAAIEASGAQIVTVSLRRAALAGGESIQDALDPKHFTYLPNSAGCYTAEDAVRTLRLARAAGGWTLVKLEVIGDKETLYPDVQETIKAAITLISEGFEVMAYTNDDPVIAKKLEELGCVAVMPLAAPIGSGLGIQNPLAISQIVQNANVPVLVDAGVGTASDAAIAMELGCAGVLLNTAIAEAQNPVLMAEAMRYAVLAGRQAYKAGRMAKRIQASASSPLQGLMTSVKP